MSQKAKEHSILFRVSEAELAQIRSRQESLGVTNLSAYLRKMAIDGYILKLDLPELKEMISLLRRMSNNLNQIAKRVNASSNLYEVELKEMQHQQQQIWNAVSSILRRLERLE